MEQDQAPKSRPRTPKTVPAQASGPTEEELSRIAREAVRQPADPRLDSELARMGLGGDDAVDPHPAPSRARAAAIGPELEGLHKEVQRLERMVWGLVVVIAVLVVAVVYLLVR
ncbi:MAG TPA: hypothetical protein VGQ31_11765 [Candidatus Limnocylindrales bacterium]|jgi:hypothetical protein|nr:hypothetical protein [Candidatus Limnocylindrales bacterium]